MRRFLVPFVLAQAGIAGVACVHEERRPSPVVSGETRAFVPPVAPTQYLLGDPSGQITHVLPLHGGAQGVIVEKRRVVISRGEPRMAADQAPDAITGVLKLPSRFGGGFLFWTESSLYRSDAFDSALVPIVRTPDSIDTISLGPKAIMVRTRNGERWGLSLPKGERVPLTPLGLVDVVALDEGRALGFDDRGSVFTSVDHGAHWVDATVQVKGKPVRVFLHGEELWLEDDQSSAMRLEPDGHLSWFDKVPEDTASEFRPRDPRWRGADFPLRAAIRAGVAIDESTALVIEAGDVYRIDTHTGDVVSVVAGKLPPDSSCQGMPVPGDVLFACLSRSGSGSAFVVSHTLTGGDGPIIEQSFGQANLGFFGSDDGGLAYGGPCVGAPAAGMPMTSTVCVRMPSGAWEERDVSLITTDAGALPTDVSIARWIPRGDGRVVAVVVEPQPGLYDPQTGTLTPVSDELRNYTRGGPTYYGGRGGRVRYSKHSGGVYSLIDTSWSFAGNVIHASGPSGEPFDLLEDGRIKTSPYSFDTLFTGNLGVGKSKDGRLYQTIDHGQTWNETATPPTGMEALELLACSTVGCDFGAFYRVGWQLRTPRVEPPVKPAAPAPSVRRVRGVELACKTSGPVVQKLMARTDSSPEDLGLGAVRLQTTSEKNDYLYVRVPVSRGIIMAWAGGGEGGATGGDNESTPALRTLLSGYSATKDDSDTLTVNGPVKSMQSLRRGVSYVPLFETNGRVVRSGILLSDVLAAARRAGLTTDEILANGDPTENGSPFPITPLDPNAVGDVAMHDPANGIISVFRGERARVTVRAQNANASGPIAFSGVALPNDETAILENESGGSLSHVYKVGPGGLVDLFDFGSVNDSNQYHPANPDALALGPKNELAIIRTPSGGDPPSELDPAYVVVQGMPAVQLAAWSTMKLADDPACKSETGGHRATIQAIGPWIRVTTPDLKIDDTSMLARVRWTPNRVCVEGFEVKMPPVTLSVPAVPGSGGYAQNVTASTWLVAKGSTFARVSVGEGVEWRQPLDCTIVSTGP